MRRLTKAFLTIVIPVFMLLCCTATASAEGAIADADFNNGTMHWNISADNVLTISGGGATPDYSESVNAPWYAYRSQIGSIVVEEGVTGLGDYALYGLSGAVSVSLPNSLTALGRSCFQGCGSLTAIDLPEGITALPYGAFWDCSSLKSIVIPEGVTHINNGYLFCNCRSLTSITLPNTLQYLGGGGYWNCFYGTSITDIYYNGTLSQWLGISFSGDSYELPMQAPCNLYIGGERLTNLTIPADVTSVPAYAFQYVSLSSVTLPVSVTGIGEYAFYGGSTGSVRMTDSVTAVGTNAFANCSSLKKVYYAGDQSKWSAIAWNTGNNALIDAERFFVASFDEDVHTVYAGPVAHGSLTLSDAYCVAGDVITIYAQPDLGWRLKCIYVNGAEIEGNSFTAEAGMDYVVTAEFEFYMDVTDYGACGPNLTWYLFDNNELVINGTGPMNNYNTYSSYSPWYNYRGIIQSIAINEGVTSIGAYAFSGCTLVESIVLPDSVERIGAYAFQKCSTLTTVELSAGLNYVAAWSFENCSLRSIYYPGDIASWLRINFADGTRSGFPQSVTQNLYIGGELVENLVIPEGVTRISAAAFKGYQGLHSVSFPDSLQVIGDYAFGGCTGLQSVVFPAGFDMIGERAFDCGLTSAEFMGNAPSMGACAFGETSGYNKSDIVIYYHAGTAGWASPNWNGYYAACVEAFSDYSVLDADNRNTQGVLFTLNETAKTATVGDGSGNPNNAGYYGAQKGAVVIPDAVTKNGTAYRVIGIGPGAFSQNRHVVSVSVGTGVTSIIPSAFAACPKLETITVSSGNEYYSSTDGVLYDVSGLYLYVYPGGKSDERFAVPDTVKTIGPAAFYDNEHLRSLTVGRNVSAIYRGAFCGLTNLAEITLPFIGTRERNADNSYNYYSEIFSSVFGVGYYGKDCLSGRSENNHSYGEGSLKNVVVTGGGLYRSAFSDCRYIQEIALAAVPSEIPESCFSNCAALEKLTFAGYACDVGDLVLPEGIESIGSSAFANCRAITSATLPASLASMDSSAFSGAGLEEFSVAAGNRSYSTDSWGVLYNYDKTLLVQYPSCRKWPYYNVASTATGISTQAFSGCGTLVNLYIPNSVTSFSTNGRGQAISGCPNMTLCCYTGSAAYSYALDSGLTAWYMDNKTLQGIRLYSLPEQTVQVMGCVDLDGLYVVGNYGGKELQIDDYAVSYDQRTSGVKTVTVEYQGRTVTFEMVLYVSSAGNIIAFRCDEDLEGKKVLIAVYNKDGAMLHSGEAIIASGEAQIGVSGSVYQNADYAKLFILEEKTFAPAAGPEIQPVH